jgi:hypothetical protein
MQLRRSLISKLFAVWFVVLIVVPFTAPFRAWDPGTPISKPVNHDLKASDKLHDDAVMAAVTPSDVPSHTGVVVSAARTIGLAPPHGAFHSVLRL